MKNFYYCLRQMVCFLMLTLLVCSCGNKAEKERLQKENDSLRVSQQEMEEQVNSYFASMNEISDNLQKVVALGGYISNQAQSPEGIKGKEETINENLELVAQIIQKSHNEIAQLKSRLKSSGMKVAELERTIERLTAELTQQSELIERMRIEMAAKDSLIGQQKVSIRDLKSDVAQLSTDLEEQKSAIARQDEAMNSAWYVFGTSKELKAEQIVTREGVSKKVMEGDFNKDYFVKIDLRKVTQIPLYAKRAKLLTTHPSDSYLLEKQNGQYTLRILDPSRFWSVSRYLVIQTN